MSFCLAGLLIHWQKTDRLPHFEWVVFDRTSIRNRLLQCLPLPMRYNPLSFIADAASMDTKYALAVTRQSLWCHGSVSSSSTHVPFPASASAAHPCPCPHPCPRPCPWWRLWQSPSHCLRSWRASVVAWSPMQCQQDSVSHICPEQFLAGQLHLLLCGQPLVGQLQHECQLLWRHHVEERINNQYVSKVWVSCRTAFFLFFFILAMAGGTAFMGGRAVGMMITSILSPAGGSETQGAFEAAAIVELGGALPLMLGR